MKPRALSWKPSEPAALNARRVLPGMLRDYFDSGRKLDQEAGARDLHGFRLKTKHLRYTLEAFVSIYGPGLKQKIDSLRPIQNALGDVNDCQVLLTQLRKKLPHAVRSHVEKRSAEKQKEFLRYWREKFDAAHEEKKWAQYLTRSARVKPAK